MEFYATLGSACTKPSVLDHMFRAGMTGARLNLSHTTLSRCTSLLKDGFWPAAKRAGAPTAHLILDMQGPELRIGELPNPIPLKPGDTVLMGDGGIPVPKTVLEHAKPGQEISIDDSALLLQVRKSSSSNLLCKVLRGGALRSRKSMSLPGAQMDAPTLTQADLDNLALAGDFGVTHILQPPKLKVNRVWNIWTASSACPMKSASPGGIWETPCPCGSSPEYKRTSPAAAGNRDGPSAW